MHVIAPVPNPQHTPLLALMRIRDDAVQYHILRPGSKVHCTHVDPSLQPRAHATPQFFNNNCRLFRVCDGATPQPEKLRLRGWITLSPDGSDDHEGSVNKNIPGPCACAACFGFWWVRFVIPLLALLLLPIALLGRVHGGRAVGTAMRGGPCRRRARMCRGRGRRAGYLE